MRCPPRTERLAARLRLAHLFQGADLAPHGFPPQAILVIRRIASPHNVSLKTFRLRPEWELEMREQIAQLWRRAVRPVRGHVPLEAEALLFQDTGEWLACFGVAVERRSVERHWCWQASLGTGLAVSSSQALVRVWSQTARFIPAAIAQLARWGVSAQVLQTLQPDEADLLLAALSVEFALPRFNTSGDARSLPPRALPPRTSSGRQHLARLDGPTSTAVDTNAFDEQRIENEDAPEASAGVDGRTALDAEGAQSAPWTRAPWMRWLPAVDAACERLPPRTQRLFAMAVALFHAPAVARNSRFVAQVGWWIERAHIRQERVEDLAPTPSTRATQHQESATPDERTRESRAADRLPFGSRDEGNESAAQIAATGNAQDFYGHTHTAQDKRGAEVSPLRRVTPSEETRESVCEMRREPAGEARSLDGAACAEIFDEQVEVTTDSPWANLEGCETELGGVLFLFNLFARLRLPECFDDEFHLSEHLNIWGLAELFARALLGDLCEQYETDPMWPMLAHLDGRPVDEPPAARLRVGQRFRLPAEWLKRFMPDETTCEVCTSGARLVLWHRAGKFVLAERECVRAAPGDARALAAEEAEHYRAQGIDVQLRFGRTRPPVWPGDSFGARARPPLTRALRRWLGWTFPFLRYVLARALTDGQQTASEELARVLLVKRGRLFCTKTHVDLLMEMNQVSLPVRRAGLDATPGWISDAMRVVSIHYQ
ncbi:MAG TPA: hypothetical protein VM911_14460 [Pyrinomonadaceae bacterium]|nr:hypothetical protein [Pyrinomonadaceae bacterium]